MQRIILRQLKASVHRLQGVAPPEIERYYQAYKREFKNYEKISNKNELLEVARRSDIIFGADFHPYSQSQRTHLRILRELAKGKRPVILALEAIDFSHQKHLDDFQKGKINDRLFLKKINYSQSWGFPWENYKVLFDFAKSAQIPVFGINQSKQAKPAKSGLGRRCRDLEHRDAFSAAKIAELSREHPGALVYVIYGDLHMAASHLPRMTKRCLGNDGSRFLTIFQNSESLYWKLAQRKLEERVDVLRLRPDAFCVVNSPPWMKWQAYLNFLEQTLEYDANESKAIVDYNDHVSHFIRIIRDLWGVEGGFNDFHVYAHGDVKFAQYVNRHFSKRDFAKLIMLVNQGRSFFIPHPPLFYLETAGVNHLSSLAGQYIHAKMRKEEKVHFRFPSDFVPLIWIEAVGFFASKLINPRRKFNTVRDLPSRHQVTLLVLEQRLLDQRALATGQSIKIIRRHKNRGAREYLEAAHTIGALIGNKMYKSFRRGRLDQVTLQRWLRVRVEPTPSFYRFYVSVLAALKSIPVGEGSKNERL